MYIYVRIGTAANLNADRGLNATDVRTHESVDRRAQSTPLEP